MENSPEFITGQILEMDALSQSEVSQELTSCIVRIQIHESYQGVCFIVRVELSLKDSVLAR